MALMGFTSCGINRVHAPAVKASTLDRRVTCAACITKRDEHRRAAKARSAARGLL